MMSVRRTGREERMGATARGAVRSCKGSSYIEYIVVATAMAAAAMALWDGGNFRGARQELINRHDIQMDRIAGSVAPDTLP